MNINLLVPASSTFGLVHCHLFSPVVKEIFVVFKMENTNSEEIGKGFFDKFCENPRGSTIETMQGSHKYISSVITRKNPPIKKSILIDIFNEFTVETVRDYVFHRMSKKLLLELALRVLQDIIQNGVGRAASMKLILTKAVDGKNTVGIAPDGRESEGSSTLSATEVLDASFKLADRQGLSPDVTFSIGKSRQPAYQQPDENGYFTPSRAGRTARKSLAMDFQVSKLRS